jgi:alpha-glucuronidase
VNVEASERNGWGQWHRADDKGVGMDRTIATGTGYTGQYGAEIARVFENLATTPDDIVLFFHHVPYTFRLHSGKTVIQTIYDMHYEGAEAVEGYASGWRGSVFGKVDRERYNAVLAQLEYQAGQAEVWRDAVNTWFSKESGIPDQGNRETRYRIEAESMTLDGYVPVDVTPSEDASGGKAVSCPVDRCSASFKYQGPEGKRSFINIEYFDQSSGSAHYRVFVNLNLIDEWTADLHLLPGRNDTRLDSTTSTRRTIISRYPISTYLKPGDVIRIEGNPDGRESAALDYVEIWGFEPLQYASR